MTSQKKLQAVFWKIMRQMYAEADPPLDLAKYVAELKAKGKKSPENWYMAYYLSEKRQREILDKACAKLTEREKRHMKAAVYLGFSPSAVRKGAEP